MCCESGRTLQVRAWSAIDKQPGSVERVARPRVVWGSGFEVEEKLLSAVGGELDHRSQFIHRQLKVSGPHLPQSPLHAQRSAVI